MRIRGGLNIRYEQNFQSKSREAELTTSYAQLAVADTYPGALRANLTARFYEIMSI